jgi:L-seryl-tRNA(Ser) seleniumtransferase
MEAVLREYRRGRAVTQVPVLRQIFASADEVEARARRVIDQFKGVKGLTVELRDGVSAVGGGAAPGVEIPTKLVSIRHGSRTADHLEEGLRSNDPPVIVRIEDGLVLLDLRTVSTEDEPMLIQAIQRLAVA